MNETRRFVLEQRPGWERLEALVTRARRRLASLSPAELRELGLLHRQVAADLAAARTFHADSRVVGYLNDLALRSHNAVYRAPRLAPLDALRRLAGSIPAAVRRHPGALAASTLLFATGALLGAFGTALDERVASIAVGSSFVERLREGHYWIEEVREVLPGEVRSTGILTNNLTVTFLVFALGFTGLLAAFVLFKNGAMLGSVLVLAGQYGLLGRFGPFVTAHGVIEISAVLVAGAAGFCLFDGWLHPGERSRQAGLRHGAREGLHVLAAAVPALVVAGPVEALLSMSDAVPGWLKVALGLGLGAAYWAWLLAWPWPPESSLTTSPAP